MVSGSRRTNWHALRPGFLHARSTPTQQGIGDRLKAAKLEAVKANILAGHFTYIYTSKSSDDVILFYIQLQYH